MFWLQMYASKSKTGMTKLQKKKKSCYVMLSPVTCITVVTDYTNWASYKAKTMLVESNGVLQ